MFVLTRDAPKRSKVLGSGSIPQVGYVTGQTIVVDGGRTAV